MTGPNPDALVVSGFAAVAFGVLATVGVWHLPHYPAWAAFALTLAFAWPMFYAIVTEA